VGGDLLHCAGIDLLYSKDIVDWLGNTIEIHDVRNFHPSDLDVMMEACYTREEEESFGEDFLDAFATPILDAKYEQVDVDDAADNQKHLTPTQREEFKAVFHKYRKLFDGTLGVFPHKKCHIELEEGAEPVFARQYPVPHIHRDVLKKELEHLVQLGALSRVGASEWASPTLVTPKKDVRVR
jgi:hypothetical protein